MRKSLQEIVCDKFLNVPWHKRMEVLRVMYGWTMKEAAGKCGTILKIYWNWENGKSTPIRNNSKVISEVFNISEEDMFGSLDIWKAPGSGR